MDNEATMRQFYDFANDHDIEGFASLISDDLVEHAEAPPGIPQTKEGVKQFFAMYFAAFPDLRMDVQDVISSGDTGVARVRVTGTNTGDFMGMPATGKAIDVEGIDIVRFGDDGLAAEHWGLTDTMKMMQQLGVVPEGAPA
jgi:steroid delta-isomerase-like uncharacterized protein